MFVRKHVEEIVPMSN